MPGVPIRCANCRSYITDQELQMRKPPPHAWRVTPEGARVLAEREGQGVEHPACPECGQRTLIYPGT